MAIPRFHHDGPLGSRRRVALSAAAAHHAARVLRLRVGDAVVLFNGEGGEYPARICAMDKSGVTVDTADHEDRECESPIRVTLAQAISSGERMDYTLQKAVELGVASIQPLASERCVVRLSGERAERRVQHWQQVVISACEQSGRNRVPQVAPIVEFDHWVASSSGQRIMLSPLGQLRLADLKPGGGEMTLLAGPEGGFSEAEVHAAERAGFTPARLGPRVLRTETAALAALAAIQVLWGDF